MMPRRGLIVPRRLLGCHAGSQQALLMVGGAPAGVTWSPSDKDADVTLSGSNLIATLNNTSGSIFGGVRATQSRAHTDNRYFVCEHGGASLDTAAGIATSTATLNGIPGDDANGFGYVPGSNTKYNGGSGSSNYLSQPTIIGVMVDCDAGTIILKRAGQFFTTSYSFTPGTTVYPMWGPGTTGSGTFVGTYDGNATDIGLDEGYSPWGGTWNPADKSANVTLSGSDLIATVTSGGGSVRGTVGKNSGKWGFQVTRGASDNVLAGVGTSSASLSQYPGQNPDSWAYYWNSNQRFTNNSASAMPAKKSIVKVGVHLNNGVVVFIADGTVGPAAYSGFTGTFFPMWGSSTTSTGSRTGTGHFAGTLPWQPAGSSAWQ